MKVIVYDEEYWKKIINFNALIEYGMIDRNDLSLFDFASDVEDMFNKIVSYFEMHYLK